MEIYGILDRTLIRERFSMKSKMVHMLVSNMIHAVVEASSSVCRIGPSVMDPIV